MTGDLPPRSRIWTIHVRQPDGDLTAEFTIDERIYPDRDAAKAVVTEANQELRRRGVPAEFRVRGVRPDAPGADLPTWDEYRQRLPDLGAEDQA